MRVPTFQTLLLALVIGLPSAASAQLAPAFTYQGRLEDGGLPKNGTVDLRFDAFIAATGSTALTSPRILDAVPVVDGVFSVKVDLGTSVFLGDAIFVEIGVREDNLGDGSVITGFTTLAPRQEITAAPYALHAERVAFDAIGGQQIVNSSISSQDVADGSLTATDVNTSSLTVGLQRRLTAACPVGQALRDISATGVAVCYQPVSAVTGAAGSGINATTSITGAVTLSTDAAEAQSRLTGECQRNPAAALRRLNDDGSVNCVLIGASPAAAAPVVLDSVGDVGSHLSMRRADGLTIVAAAYYDDTNNRLKFVHCATTTCSPAPTPVIIDDPAVNDVGQFVSLALQSPGPVMAYYDATADDLKFASCANAECTGTVNVRTVDSGGDVGRFAEIVQFTGQFGIAYFDASGNTYKWALCNDRDCSAPQITTLAGLSGGGVLVSDIAASRNQSSGSGNPLPFFVVLRGGSEVVAISCGNSACSTHSETVIETGDIGPPLTTATRSVGGKRRHWIAYGQPAAARLRTRVCPDEACASVLDVGGTFLGGTPLGTTAIVRNEGTVLLLQTDTTSSDIGVVNFERLNFSGSAYRLPGVPTANGAIDATLIDGGGIGIFYFDTAAAARDLVYQRCAQSDCREL